MILTDEQIDICVKFWGKVIAERGYGPVTKGLINKFQRHLKKLLEGDLRDSLVMASLNRVPLFPLEDALKSSKIDNPFPNEWIDLVFRDDGSVDLFRDKMFVKEICNEDLSG
jgi:hypothetical protein